LYSQSANSSTCRICGNNEDCRQFIVREMQLGFRDEFEYFECSKCGCLQIKDFPENLKKYYPEDYYSFRIKGPSVQHPSHGIRGLRARLTTRILSRHYFRQKSEIGKWLSGRSSINGDYPFWIKNQELDLKLSLRSRILDVGCGKGELLLDLRQLGFTNLTGLDPFLSEEILYESGVRILNSNLDELKQQFDFVMLHHSLEHVPDPKATLFNINKLLRPGQYLLIRVPLAGSWAWREYGVNWGSLDAPRHFFLHTTRSMELLAAETGFEVVETLFDADGFSHWVSELYRRNIPLVDERSPWRNPNQKTFSREELRQFAELDARLNKLGEADSAAFYLRKTRQADA
jgi:SAM-dependent methyltransferase